MSWGNEKNSEQITKLAIELEELYEDSLKEIESLKSDIIEYRKQIEELNEKITMCPKCQALHDLKK